MPGFTVGGAIQIIVNNLIGFTADPDECYSSRFSSDIAKRLPIPIFHVNAEDPEAVIRVASLAVEYRYTFHTDVIIDLIGYRRHGHSEVDDPTITQPLRYAKIKNHPPLYEIYAQQIGVDPSARVKELQVELAEAQKQATRMTKSAVLAKLPAYWSNYSGGPYKPEYEVDTGLSAKSGRGDQQQPHYLSAELSYSSQDQETARATQGDGARPAAIRLRHGRGAGLWFAAPARHAGAP